MRSLTWGNSLFPEDSWASPPTRKTWKTPSRLEERMVFLGSKEKNTEVLFIHLSNTHCVQRQYRFAELLWFSPFVDMSISERILHTKWPHSWIKLQLRSPPHPHQLQQKTHQARKYLWGPSPFFYVTSHKQMFAAQCPTCTNRNVLFKAHNKKLYKWHWPWESVLLIWVRFSTQTQGP